MGIDFTPERWERVRETYRQWWAGTLERPIMPMILSGRDPGRECPAVPLLSQATCTDLSFSAEAIIDRLDYELSTYDFIGDAFPMLNLGSFGPGVVAAFLGARIDNETGNVWFHPREILPLSEMHFEYDPDNVWFNRIKDICKAGIERWQGQVIIEMTDLGGTLDILSTFRPGELLLLDMYDDPDEVKRLTWEIHELWHRYFNEIHQVLQPVNPGYSSWCRIFSDVPYFMLQCDFCYMIGPDMFDEFIKPELAASTRRLSRSFYHMDGRGQLPHLDSLLSIPELTGVQWQPGEGAPASDQWPYIFTRIFAAGKKTQMLSLSGDPVQMHQLLNTTGIGPGTYCAQSFSATVNEREEVEQFLRSFGVS